MQPLPPPIWSHPPWFYKVIAVCVVLITIAVMDYVYR